MCTKSIFLDTVNQDCLKDRQITQGSGDAVHGATSWTSSVFQCIGIYKVIINVADTKTFLDKNIGECSLQCFADVIPICNISFLPSSWR